MKIDNTIYNFDRNKNANIDSLCNSGLIILIKPALVDCDVVYDNYKKLSKTIIFIKFFIFLQIIIIHRWDYTESHCF